MGKKLTGDADDMLDALDRASADWKTMRTELEATKSDAAIEEVAADLASTIRKALADLPDRCVQLESGVEYSIRDIDVLFVGRSSTRRKFARVFGWATVLPAAIDIFMHIDGDEDKSWFVYRPRFTRTAAALHRNGLPIECPLTQWPDLLAQVDKGNVEVAAGRDCRSGLRCHSSPALSCPSYEELHAFLLEKDELLAAVTGLLSKDVAEMRAHHQRFSRSLEGRGDRDLRDLLRGRPEAELT